MKLYNTMTRTSEEFVPANDKQVKLYSCGPTVYDYQHIGNWATYIRWDVLVRVLRASGYDVKWIMNITDVGHLTSDADEGEDKLEKGAKREGKSAWEVADYYAQAFKRGLKILNIQLGSTGRLVKATDHIAQQIALVKSLDEKGYLYKIDDGMYFDTSKLTDYGKLARLDVGGLQAGARVSMTAKRNPTDFAVWKFSPKNKQRDMEWWAPWGGEDSEEKHIVAQARNTQVTSRVSDSTGNQDGAVRGSWGFPGWHLECSAMAMHYLGDTLDIHTGGIDHIPVHHTNEIAQSEALTDKPFARFWLHSNFLLVNDQKIAKSTGNGITLKDIAARNFSGQDLRLLVLQSHYRSEAIFTWKILEAARSRRKNWQAAASLRWQVENDDNDFITQVLNDTTERLLEVLTNDLNTPEALALLDKTFDAVMAKGITKTNAKAFNALLDAVRNLLGINLFDDDITDTQKQLLQKRLAARQAGDWATADLLRAELESQKLIVRDSKTGQRWARS